MALPAVPLIGLELGDVISGPICGTYCLASIVAMVALIVYRRSTYRMAAVVPVSGRRAMAEVLEK